MLKKIAIFSFLFLTACNKNETNENQKNEVPKALQEETINLGRYRSQNDLSEELYQELVSKSAELKNLETELENFNPNDTLNIFYRYNGKSDDYYLSATNQAETIKDSVLKNRILSLIKDSNKKYDEKTTSIHKLVRTINQKQNSINDCHQALKIIKTIPIIEKYQNENIPKKSPFEKVIKNQNLLIEKVKKNTPKY